MANMTIFCDIVDEWWLIVIDDFHCYYDFYVVIVVMIDVDCGASARVMVFLLASEQATRSILDFQQIESFTLVESLSWSQFVLYLEVQIPKAKHEVHCSYWFHSCYFLLYVLLMSMLISCWFHFFILNKICQHDISALGALVADPTIPLKKSFIQSSYTTGATFVDSDL